MGSTPEIEGRTVERFHRGDTTAPRPHHDHRARGDRHPHLAQAAVVTPRGGKLLHLDLSGVPFMDSSGLNLLVLLRRCLHAEGGRLAVTGLQRQPARLLQITETYDLFAADTAAVAGSGEALTA